MLSLHWDRDFFVELLATATLNVRPHHFARQLDERIARCPDWSQRDLQATTVEPYGRQVLARFPDMLRQLKGYTRIGSENGHAVLRCYLPVQAGHNLLLAGALSLTAATGADHEVAKAGTGGQTTKARSGTTMEKKLASITSLVLPKETLEQSLQLLAEDIGVEIEILGQDLQLVGITKNQSLVIDIQDQPASKIRWKFSFGPTRIRPPRGPPIRGRCWYTSLNEGKRVSREFSSRLAPPPRPGGIGSRRVPPRLAVVRYNNIVMELFRLTCVTCHACLSVRDRAVIGKILSCPRCGSMVQVHAPDTWPVESSPVPSPQLPDSSSQLPVPAPSPQLPSPRSPFPAPQLPARHLMARRPRRCLPSRDSMSSPLVSDGRRSSGAWQQLHSRVCWLPCCCGVSWKGASDSPAAGSQAAPALPPIGRNPSASRIGSDFLAKASGSRFD